MAKVRTRFAPSPTGRLHIGGLRTALYNRYFADANGGDFILRIEDTDQKRIVPESEAYLYDAFEWLGITCDESPQKGGPHGPYRQSERLPHYTKAAENLVKKGKAYLAFDTPEELEAMREKQHKRGVAAPKYDATMRMSMKNTYTLSPQEVEERLAKGHPYVIRLLVDHLENIRFKDEIRGWIQVKGNTLDDKVILKEDKFPTYHLANVVDDHMMEITHVIRGEEWLPSTPAHILLYRYLGWEPPKFAHLPLLLNSDGKGKLSKRNLGSGDNILFPIAWYDARTGTEVPGFRESGFLPEAVSNFIALLGWHPTGNQELFTPKELGKAFSFNRIKKAGVRVSIEKARWFNEQHLRRMDNATLIARYLLPELQKRKINPTKPYMEAFCDLVKERITYPHQLWEEHTYFFLAPQKGSNTLLKAYGIEGLATSQKEVFTRLADTLERIESWEANHLQRQIRAFAKSYNFKIGNLMKSLRITITGKNMGPNLPATLALIGKEEVVRRLRSASF